MQGNESLFQQLSAILQGGGEAMLMTVLESKGSTPRGAGARMLAYGEDALLGTIGGGAAEYAAVQHAKKLLKERQSGIREYMLHANAAADIGMVCGGELRVLFQYMAPGAYAAMEAIARQQEQPEKSWLVTYVEKDMRWRMGCCGPGGEGLTGVDLPKDVLGPLCGPQAVLQEIQEALVLVEPLAAPGRVCIFGGGHVSQALVPVLAAVGFRTLVFEDREQFADAALFPGAEGVYLCRMEEIEKTRAFQAGDYVIIVTRGHKDDFEVLRQALQAPLSYIGMIGSRTKIAVTKKNTLAAGYTEADFARVHTPIGLSIGAQTPAEIAISIAAELIAHRAGLKIVKQSVVQAQ